MTRTTSSHRYHRCSVRTTSCCNVPVIRRWTAAGASHAWMCIEAAPILLLCHDGHRRRRHDARLLHLSSSAASRSISTKRRLGFGQEKVECALTPSHARLRLGLSLLRVGMMQRGGMGMVRRMVVHCVRRALLLLLLLEYGLLVLLLLHLHLLLL